MPFSGKSNQLLARVNFPPYTVHCLTERHFLVAGGGGSAKTGIRNVIEIYELTNEGVGCRAKSVTHFETGKQAIMNCAIYNSSKFFVLFAGMEGLCQTYKLKQGVKEVPHLNGFVKDSEMASQPSLRHRKSKDHTKPNSNKADEDIVSNGVINHDLVFDIKLLDSFQTDFSSDPFQKLARFSPASKILATAGADGHIRVWKYPEMRKIYEIHAHQDDVDDLDFSSLGDKFVSISRDGHGKIWKSDDGSLVCELKYNVPHESQSKYIYRNCRYSCVENDKSKPLIFITLNPAVRKKPASPSFLSKWDGLNFSVLNMVSTGREMLSTMAISDDGKFIGLGTQEGSVAIYIAFSLQQLYRVDHVHSIFVTGLEFLHSSDSTRLITGDHEASLISVSVDNHINIHFIPNRSTIGIFTLIILFTITLFGLFVIMDFFNL